jgi:hypothetical protein
MKYNISKILIWVFYFCICLLTVSSLIIYPGSKFIYFLFSIAFNGLLLAGFRKNRIFFDTFIGLFFWLGYWLKFSASLLFQGGAFQEFTGNFDYSGSAFDEALLVSTTGAVALVIASIIREKFLFSYTKNSIVNEHRYLFDVYMRYRKIILALFIFLFVMIAGTNVWLGIYQRGGVPQTILPFGLNGVYTWLLLFGLTSFSTLILECEFRINKNPYLVAMISLLEITCSNLSMLSRGMILNASALILGANESQKTQASLQKLRFKVITVTAVLVLFLSSVYAVNILRVYRDSIHSTNISLPEVMSGPYASRVSVSEAINASVVRSSLLFINRWTGIEGVMAVTSYPNLGWDLWKKAWQEKFSNIGTSFYDLEIAKSTNIENVILLNHHFISMPGILAFFYYPGSYIILFVSMIMLGILGAVIEIFVFKLGGRNIILCALMAQIIASRYAHFGYAPKRSYLLVGAIILNVLIIYSINKICERVASDNSQNVHDQEPLTAGSPEYAEGP